MPIFFFHVRGGLLEVEDEEGVALADAAAARLFALRGARSIIAAEVLEGRLPMGERIVVEDSDHRTVLAISFADAVERTD